MKTPKTTFFAASPAELTTAFAGLGLLLRVSRS